MRRLAALAGKFGQPGLDIGINRPGFLGLFARIHGAIRPGAHAVPNVRAMAAEAMSPRRSR